MPVRIMAAARRYVIGAMPHDPSGELGAMRLSDLLIVFGNWRSRFPTPSPRTVHVSDELRASAAFAEHAEALGAITSLVHLGGDLTPYLSKRVRKAYVQKAKQAEKSLPQRPDLDLLLADWSIHHLHLGTEMQGTRIERTGDLLFAVFHPDDAYFIGIYSHDDDWALQETVETIVRNWPDSGILKGSVSGARMTSTSTDAERLALRECGIASMVEVDGRVWMPQGMTMAGTPMPVTLHVNEVMHALFRWQREAGSVERHALSVLKASGFAAPKEPWFPKIEDDCCWLVSGQSRVPLFNLT